MICDSSTQNNTYLSYAKINLFLKIVGKDCFNGASYHLLQSRFMRVKSLYDTLTFYWDMPAFEIVGIFDCAMEQNTIYKAYRALLPYLTESQKATLKHLQVWVDKKIPSGGGLGGGSSNAACFLQVVSQSLNLDLDLQALMELGAQVGSDVPFFLSGLEIANVEGRGEIVESCQNSKESQDFAPFEVEIIMPKLHCNTTKVFQKYSDSFYDEARILQTKKQNWLQKSNGEILHNESFENNDLLAPVLTLYPELESYCKKNLFLSGSGSCFWRKKPQFKEPFNIARTTQ